MNTVQKMVNEILREYGVIDTGASQAVGEAVEFQIKEAIRSQLQSVHYAHQLVTGMLSNPDYAESSDEVLIDYAIGLSDQIINTVIAGKADSEHTH